MLSHASRQFAHKLFSNSTRTGLTGWVFDLDGTTAGKYGLLVKQSFVRQFKLRNIDISLDLILQRMGTRKLDHIKHMLTAEYPQWKKRYPGESDAILKSYFERDANDMLKGFNADILQGMSTLCKPIPEKMLVLKELENRHKKIAYNSGFNRQLVSQLLSSFPTLDTSISVASDEVSLGRPDPEMLMRILQNPNFACKFPWQSVTCDDMPDGMRVTKNMQDPCWSIWDLTHSCLLNPKSADDAENSPHLERQRELLIEKFIPHEIRPDYIVTSSKGLLLVDDHITDRIKNGSRPGDQMVYIARGNALEEFKLPSPGVHSSNQ